MLFTKPDKNPNYPADDRPPKKNAKTENTLIVAATGLYAETVEKP
jgi:hypothetical protein